MILFSRSVSISHCRCVVSCFVTATIDMSERYTVPRAGHPLHEIVQRFIIKPEGSSSVIGR